MENITEISNWDLKQGYFAARSKYKKARSNSSMNKWSNEITRTVEELRRRDLIESAGVGGLVFKEEQAYCSRCNSTHNRRDAQGKPHPLCSRCEERIPLADRAVAIAAEEAKRVREEFNAGRATAEQVTEAVNKRNELEAARDKSTKIINLDAAFTDATLASLKEAQERIEKLEGQLAKAQGRVKDLEAIEGFLTKDLDISRRKLQQMEGAARAAVNSLTGIFK